MTKNDNDHDGITYRLEENKTKSIVRKSENYSVALIHFRNHNTLT